MTQHTSDNLPIVELHSSSAELLADLWSVAADLAFVVACCEQSLALREPTNDDQSVVPTALWSAALIAYARWFNHGVRGHLTVQDVQGLPTEGDAVGFHNHLIDLRNKHLAHAVNPFEQVRLGAALGVDERRVVGVGVLSVKHVSGVPETLRGIRDLAQPLASVVQSRSDQQQQVVQAEQPCQGDGR